MKSVKRGREPSFMNGIMGIVSALFGLFWTFFVISNGGGIFGLFGLIFVVIGILNSIRGFRNALGKHRTSEFDVVDEQEEPDPWNEKFGESDPWGDNFDNGGKNPYSGSNSFCPYCGNEVRKDYEYCNNCGRKLPD